MFRAKWEFCTIHALTCSKWAPILESTESAAQFWNWPCAKWEGSSLWESYNTYIYIYSSTAHGNSNMLRLRMAVRFKSCRLKSVSHCTQSGRFPLGVISLHQCGECLSKTQPAHTSIWRHFFILFNWSVDHSLSLLRAIDGVMSLVLCPWVVLSQA